MDADLKYIINSVCGINDTQVAFKTVNDMGIQSVEDFAATPHDTTFQYDSSGTMTNVNANHQLKLSQAIAYKSICKLLPALLQL